MLKAVCLLSVNADGNILAVTRKNDRTRWSLPGGKVEPGETEIEALFREVKEETGLTPVLASISRVFERTCKGEVDYETVVYFAVTVIGRPHTSEPIDIAWVDKQKLIDGPFGQYNESLFKAVGLI